jgi:excisionase family DNA binding protein
MQAAILIERSEWENLTERLTRLEERVNQSNEPPANEILTTRQVAQRLGMTEEGVRRARREGRLTGVKIDEKHYGFKYQEITQYLKRYNHKKV